MSPRTTAILALVAAALGAFIWLYEIRGAEEREQAEEAQKRLFAGIESEQIDWIAFRSSDGRAVRVERRDDAWRIAEPIDFPADTFAVDSIASALAEVQSEAVFDEPQPLSIYGLDDETRDVRFGSDGSARALRIGDAAPMGGARYALIVGERPVYTVPGWRASALNKGLDDLREKRVLAFEVGSVARLRAAWPDGGVELEREGESWKLLSPRQEPADAKVVDDLLSDLSFLRATGFVDEPLPDAETGLDAPAFRAEIELSDERSLSLALGAAEIDGDRLVRAGSDTLYRVPTGRLEDLPREVGRYRYKRLTEFSAEDARRIEFVFHGEDEERFELTALRDESGWKTEPEEIPSEKVTDMVDTLDRLDASTILADRIGPEELAGAKLDPPRVSITVYGDEEGAPPLAELRLGELRLDGVPAQAGEDPRLYRLSLAHSQALPISLGALRSRFLESADEAPELEPPSEFDEG